MFPMSPIDRHWVDNEERRLSLLRTRETDDWIDVAVEHAIVQTWQTAGLLLVCFDAVEGEPSGDAGTLLMPDPGGAEVGVVTFDANGNVGWGHLFGDTKDQSPGGLALDSEGAGLVTGFFQGSISVGLRDGGTTGVTSQGGSNAFVMKRLVRARSRQASGCTTQLARHSLKNARDAGPVSDDARNGRHIGVGQAPSPASQRPAAPDPVKAM
jgi:hypothetical protein